MRKKIIIDGNFPSETRVAVLDQYNNIEDIELESAYKKQIKSNIYLAKVTRIEPSLQAAFIDYGDEKNGFLPFDEIHFDYHQTLSSDSKSNIIAGYELNSPKITSEDLQEKSTKSNFYNLTESEDIDIKTIEKMVDSKIKSNIDITASENEVDAFNDESNKNNHDKYCKIQEVIKKGQIILVQATKEERGNKGATFTTYISLAGKYCVLMPNKAMQHGISRKISNLEERKRLKKILDGLATEINENSSLIARTAAVGHTSLEIKKDYEYLAHLWNRIRETTLQSKAPAFIHQEDSIILKTVRDLFDYNVKELIVEGSKAYELCKTYASHVIPSQAKLIKEYKGKAPIFTKYKIEDQLIKLHQPIVNLPSGGYIVINPTEALISIDVNSGKSTSERNIEETALKTNLEAAKEIAKQSRLRDLSGLLVLDFIDLAETKHRKILERSLWEYFSRDKARIQTAPISIFGLLEMSRQRLRASFLEINSDICTYCSGKGLVRADEPNAMLILRTIENEISASKYVSVNVYATAISVIYLLNHKRQEIEFIEQKYEVKLNFSVDPNATSDSYSIEKVKKSANDLKLAKNQVAALQNNLEIYNLEPEDNPNGRRKIKKNRNLNKNNVIDDLKNSDILEPANPESQRKGQKNTKNETKLSTEKSISNELADQSTPLSEKSPIKPKKILVKTKKSSFRRRTSNKEISEQKPTDLVKVEESN